MRSEQQLVIVVEEKVTIALTGTCVSAPLGHVGCALCVCGLAVVGFSRDSSREARQGPTCSAACDVLAFRGDVLLGTFQLSFGCVF